MAHIPVDVWRLIVAFSAHPAVLGICQSIRGLLIGSLNAFDPAAIVAKLPPVVTQAYYPRHLHLPLLRVLEYAGPWFHGITAWLRIPTLEVVHLTLDEAADRHVAALPAAPSVRFLRLTAAHGSVTDAGFCTLCHGTLRRLQRLHLLELNLAGNRIGPTGAAALAASLPASVQRLYVDLRFNALRGTRCLYRLGSMLSRRFLEVRLLLAPNAIDNNGVRAFLLAAHGRMLVRDSLLVDVADVCIAHP